MIQIFPLLWSLVTYVQAKTKRAPRSGTENDLVLVECTDQLCVGRRIESGWNLRVPLCDVFAQGLRDDRDLSGRSSRPPRWCSRMKHSCESNSAARIRVGLQQNYFIFERAPPEFLD